MAFKDLVVGIVAPSAEIREVFRTQLADAGITVRIQESAEYCLGRNDSSTRRLVSAGVRLILVDMEEPGPGLQTLRVLSSTLPDAWLFVLADKTDSQTLIECMRAGARDVITKPLGPRALSEAMTRFLSEQFRGKTQEEPGNIYCVTTGKGGSGATTVAINLAASLSEIDRRRVAFIDLNYPVGDSAAYLNLRPHFTVSDALAAASRLDTVLLESFMSHAESFSVLAGFKEYVPGAPLDHKSLAKVLEVASHAYQDVVIDLPSMLDEKALHAVTEMAKVVLLILTPELPALWRTERLLQFFGKNGTRDKLRLIVNRSNKRDDITEKEIVKVLETPIFWRLPNNYSSSIQSINTGKPVVAINHSDLSRSFRELAQQLTGLKAVSRNKGLLGLLFRQ
ncbi:MAG TPA: AAA family ATPase [Acidobacteriota bacterium]|nr:AAA family ATPase [Acidobacteriota bacterium]